MSKFFCAGGTFQAVTDTLNRMFNKGIGADNLADEAITPIKLIPGLIPANKRQIILQAGKDYTTDNSNFLGAVVGQLKVTLYASATPFIGTISGGIDEYGNQIDYRFIISKDVVGAWELPPNKSFLQLYIEYNPTTKSVSYGYTEFETVYLQPSAPSTGQHWFDKGNLMIMQEWDGSAWQKRLRLMVGEAITGASSVTSVIAYAVQCQYDSGWFSVSTNFNKTVNHNSGIRIPDGIDVKYSFSLDSAGIDASFTHDVYSTISGAGVGHLITGDVVQNTRNTLNFGFGTGGVQNYRSSLRTNGYYRVQTSRTW